MPRTRLRRTLWYTLIFTVVQAAIVIVASVLQMPSMRSAHEAGIVQGAMAVTRRLPATGARIESRDLAAALAGQADIVYVEMIDPVDGERIASDEDLLAEVPALPGQRIDDVRVGTLELAADDGDGVRIVSQVVVPFRDVQGQPLLLRALAESTAVGIAMDQMVDRLAMVVPMSFLAVSILAWLLVSRTLGPLRRVSESIGRLGPDSLSAGAPELDPLDADEDLVLMQQSLSLAIERIEEGYEAQSQFVANVAHELKTPIAVMLAEAQSLRGDEASVEELQGLRDSVIEETRRLGRMVESFLVVARAARGGELTRNELVYLPEVVVDAVQHTSRFASLHDVRVRPLLPPPETSMELECRGDPDLLDSMLQNLIRNAVQFSPRGESVDVALSASAAGACISVRDRGPGVPAELAERLFERYVQAESETEGTPAGGEGGSRARGFGLGLSIATNVARLHGGRIKVRNHESGGALFTVTLPAASSTARAQGDVGTAADTRPAAGQPSRPGPPAR